MNAMIDQPTATDPVERYEAATRALDALEAEAASIGERIRLAAVAGKQPLDLFTRQIALPTLIAEARRALALAAPAYYEHELAALAPDLAAAGQALVRAHQAVERAGQRRLEAANAVDRLNAVRSDLTVELRRATRAVAHLDTATPRTAQAATGVPPAGPDHEELQARGRAMGRI